MEMGFGAIVFITLMLVVVGTWVFADLWRALLLYVFLIPFEIYLSVDAHVTTNQVFQLALLIRAVPFLLQRRQRARGPAANVGVAGVLLAAYVCWASLSLLWSGDLDASWRALFRLLTAVGVYFIIILKAREASHIESLFTASALAGGIVALYGAAQYLRGGIDPMYHLFSPFYQDITAERGAGIAVVSTFANANVLAAYAVMVLPLAATRFFAGNAAQRGLWALATAAILAVSLLTFSKGAWVAVLVMGGMWAFQTRLRWGKALGVIAFILAGASITMSWSNVTDSLVTIFPKSQETSVDPRINLWGVALRIAAEHPIRGTGLDAFTAALGDKWNAPSRAHNLYLQTLVDLGAIGFLLYFGFIATIAVRARRAYQLTTSQVGRRQLMGLLLSLCGFCGYALFDALNGVNAYNSVQWTTFGLTIAATQVYGSRVPALGLENGPPAGWRGSRRANRFATRYSRRFQGAAQRP